MNPVFLDVETSGFADDDKIVELALKARGSMPQVAHSLYNPERPIGHEAMAVTHITNKMVADAPLFLGSPLHTTLNNLLAKDHVLVAHNADFDMKFLKREGIEINGPHICTYKVAYHQDEQALLPKHTLQFLRYHFFEEEEFEGENIVAHSAASDVLVLERLFKHLEKSYTIEEMIEISSKPMLIKKFSFGKYKGEWIKDVARKDTNYLIWMRREMANMEESLRYTINYWIEHRRDI